MAGLTKRHQIVAGVSSASRNREDMVDFLCRGETPFLEALLTERMFGRIPISDSFPGSSVLPVGVASAFVLVIPVPLRFFVKRTVLSVC